MIAVEGQDDESSAAAGSRKEPPDRGPDESPRCVLERTVSGGGGGGGDETSDSSCPSSSVEHGMQFRNLIGSLRRRSRRRLATCPLGSCDIIGVSRRNSSRKLAGVLRVGGGTAGEFEEISTWKPSWRSFGYEELAAATDNFSSEKLVGKGGHAEVYKGCLGDDQVVAVKRLLLKGGTEEDRIAGFLSELGIVAHINHPNAARLLGFGVEGGLHIVLQFSPHGSLASLLHGSKEGLQWEIRFKVVLGVAEGLQYLHQGCHRRIIHRDIKASNILLAEDYEPQISDFGLAKWLPEHWSHHAVFPIEGTFGYLAPEYFMHGIVNEKTDVFAFGVLLLELITGRRAVDPCCQSLVMWAKPLLDEKSIHELVDPRLQESYDLREMKRAMLTASMCIYHAPDMRPQMEQVVKLLRGEDIAIEPSRREKRCSILKEFFDSEDYSCSSRLSDLNRHMKIALE